MNKMQLLINIGLLSCTGSVLAAEHRGHGEHPLAELDSNADGAISFIEFQAGDHNPLASMDTDGNGVLTIDEFLNGRPGPRMGRGRTADRGSRAETDDDRPQPTAEQVARMEAMREQMLQRGAERFQAMDTNGDEMLTLEELQAANFAAMDHNDDGVLDADELRPPRMGRSDPGGRGPGSGPRGEHPAQR